MIKRLSDYDEEYISYFLSRIREVSQLGDEAAIIEADKLLWEISAKDTSDKEDDEDESTARQQSSYQDFMEEYADRDINRVIDAMSKIREYISQDAPYDISFLEHMPDKFLDVAEALKKYPNKSGMIDLASVKKEFKVIRKQALAKWYEFVIGEYNSQSISGSNIVTFILGRITELEKTASKEGLLSSELQQLIRSARARACWYRTKRKLADADVAKAGGSTIRYEKMRSEARVMLTQDWHKAFPNETIPQLPD